jgi:hypothetical protein
MEFFRDPLFCALYRHEIRMIVNISQIIRDLESILVRTGQIEEAIAHYKRLRLQVYAAVQNCYLVYRDLAGRRVRH